MIQSEWYTILQQHSYVQNTMNENKILSLEFYFAVFKKYTRSCQRHFLKKSALYISLIDQLVKPIYSTLSTSDKNTCIPLENIYIFRCKTEPPTCAVDCHFLFSVPDVVLLTCIFIV